MHKLIATKGTTVQSIEQGWPLNMQKVANFLIRFISRYMNEIATLLIDYSRLDSNPLNCTCDILWLARLLKKTPNTETAATCGEPADMRGKSLVRLTPEDFNCGGLFDSLYDFKISRSTGDDYFQNIVVKMNHFVIRCMKYIFNCR